MRSKIVNTIPGQNTSPKAFAGMLVENADRIEHMACVIHWKDGVTNTANTVMTLGDAAWLDYIFREDFMKSVIGDSED